MASKETKDKTLDTKPMLGEDEDVPEGNFKEPVPHSSDNEGETAPAPVELNTRDGEQTGERPSSDKEAVNHQIVPSPEIALGALPQETEEDGAFGFNEAGDFVTGDGRRTVNPANVTWVDAPVMPRGAVSIVVFHFIGGETMSVRSDDPQALKKAYDDRVKLKAKASKK